MANKIESHNQRGGITANQVNVASQENDTSIPERELQPEPKKINWHLWIGTVAAFLAIIAFFGIGA